VSSRCAVALATVAALGAAVLVAVPWSSVRAVAATPVQGKKILGYSVRHRPITAYHVGDTASRPTAVILGQMHGDEHAGVTLANSVIRATVSVEGINLWVIPTMNPDGDAAHTRQNAHHVDLNRNWPDHWTRLTGQYHSGPEPLSEPETRAMYAFLNALRPRFIGWYTTHRYGIAETVEFGWHPTIAYLTGRARSGIVAALGGHFGSLATHDPRSALNVRITAGHARLTGWAFDIDAKSVPVAYVAYRDGVRIRAAKASSASPAVNERYHLTGQHAFGFTAAAAPGRHTFCLVFTNLGAGTANPRRCATATVPGSPTTTPTPTPTPAPSPTPTPTPTAPPPAPSPPGATASA
jgi:hypothetical protein